ncbi:unnamed protein product [Moneuplotes crassus]|uniref:Uncharacterized protein n=1 Tax=Euplotes crassus TaxID=5936 RepID=A0AAD1Y144_EUPCR|nr:unnamed protein product [Moneuplotes crassus]
MMILILLYFLENLDCVTSPIIELLNSGCICSTDLIRFLPSLLFLKILPLCLCLSKSHFFQCSKDNSFSFSKLYTFLSLLWDNSSGFILTNFIFFGIKELEISKTSCEIFSHLFIQ